MYINIYPLLAYFRALRIGTWKGIFFFAFLFSRHQSVMDVCVKIYIFMHAQYQVKLSLQFSTSYIYAAASKALRIEMLESIFFIPVPYPVALDWMCWNVHVWRLTYNVYISYMYICMLCMYDIIHIIYIRVCMYRYSMLYVIYT